MVLFEILVFLKEPFQKGLSLKEHVRKPISQKLVFQIELFLIDVFQKEPSLKVLFERLFLKVIW